MSDVIQLLTAIEQGDPHAAEQLLPLLYEELRRLAAQRLSREQPGQTLQATALVHEAYLRLVDTSNVVHWNSRGHFFAAAAEAMRRILVERARRKKQPRRGGEHQRIELDDVHLEVNGPSDDLIALDEALSRLEQTDAMSANVVKLRFFAGLTMPQVAEAFGIPLRNAERHWTYAKTWLHRELSQGESTDRP